MIQMHNSQFSITSLNDPEEKEQTIQIHEVFKDKEEVLKPKVNPMNETEEEKIESKPLILKKEPAKYANINDLLKSKNSKW
jgi:hypothetical protein